MNFQIKYLYLEQHFIQKKQEFFSGINVTIYVPLLQLRYICLESKNNQHSMLANPENKNISIRSYY